MAKLTIFAHYGTRVHTAIKENTFLTYKHTENKQIYTIFYLIFQIYFKYFKSDCVNMSWRFRDQ
jgi:hypothetical protein